MCEEEPRLKHAMEKLQFTLAHRGEFSFYERWMDGRLVTISSMEDEMTPPDCVHEPVCVEFYDHTPIEGRLERLVIPSTVEKILIHTEACLKLRYPDRRVSKEED